VIVSDSFRKYNTIYDYVSINIWKIQRVLYFYLVNLSITNQQKQYPSMIEGYHVSISDSEKGPWHETYANCTSRRFLYINLKQRIEKKRKKKKKGKGVKTGGGF